MIDRGGFILYEKFSEAKLTFPNFARDNGSDDHGMLSSVNFLLLVEIFTKLLGIPPFETSEIGRTAEARDVLSLLGSSTVPFELPFFVGVEALLPSLGSGLSVVSIFFYETVN